MILGCVKAFSMLHIHTRHDVTDKAHNIKCYLIQIAWIISLKILSIFHKFYLEIVYFSRPSLGATDNRIWCRLFMAEVFSKVFLHSF
jgi:hypothetical protein